MYHAYLILIVMLLDLSIVALPLAPEPAYTPGETLYPCTSPRNVRWPDNMLDFGTGTYVSTTSTSR
jgi:hypothetical protein